jgi:hypothetical protein
MTQAHTENEIKVFLASSLELELERAHVGDLFNDINSLLADTDVRVRLLKWENFDPAFTGERKQGEYDEQVKNADVFIALFRTLAGKYTMEEVDIAKEAYKQNGKPEKLYCFIQDYLEKREFDVDKLKAELGADYIIESFADIKDLKLKIVKILLPRLTALGIKVKETDKFVQIASVNLLRKDC